MLKIGPVKANVLEGAVEALQPVALDPARPPGEGKGGMVGSATAVLMFSLGREMFL